MKKSEKNMIILWTIYASILILGMSTSQAFCAGLCTPELDKSIAGQAAGQIASALELTSEQAGEVAQISEAFRAKFRNWIALQDDRREDLLKTAQQADEDGNISADERRIIQKKMQVMKESRLSMFTQAFFAAGSIDSVLTEEQKEKLQDLQLALVIPGEVLDSLNAFYSVLQRALSEIEAGGGLTEETSSELEQAWQALLGSAYLPDTLRARLNGRLLQAVKASTLKAKIPDSALLPGLEKLGLIIGSIIEAAQDGPINPQSLLADINGLTGIGSRLLLLSNAGKLYFFEVFMLSPAFSCQL